MSLHSIDTLEATVGDRAWELYSMVRGTVYKLRKKPFLAWSIPRIPVEDLIAAVLGNTLTALSQEQLVPIPKGLDLYGYVAEASSTAFAEYRHWFGLDSEGREREVPRAPSSGLKGASGTSSFATFDMYRADQFVVQASNSHHDKVVDLPVDLSLLNDTERDLLSMLGNGLTQAEAAEHLGFVPNPAKPTWDHRAFVQSKLRTIRRKLMGVKTQDEARAWLEARA